MSSVSLKLCFFVLFTLCFKYLNKPEIQGTIGTGGISIVEYKLSISDVFHILKYLIFYIHNSEHFAVQQKHQHKIIKICNFASSKSNYEFFL